MIEAYIGTIPPLHKSPHIWVTAKSIGLKTSYDYLGNDLVCKECEKVWEYNE